MNARQKVARRLLEACRDAPKVLQTAEEVLDLMTLLVQFLVVGGRVLPIAARRDHRTLARLGEHLAHPLVCIVALVADNYTRLDRLCQRVKSLKVTGLTRCQHQGRRLARCITDRMDLGRQASLAPTDALLLLRLFNSAPFFRAPPALR